MPAEPRQGLLILNSDKVVQARDDYQERLASDTAAYQFAGSARWITWPF